MAFETGLEYAVSVAVEGGVPDWLPAFGARGDTHLVYTYSSRIVAFAFLLGAGVALGRYAGRRIDVENSPRRFLRAVVRVTTDRAVGRDARRRPQSLAVHGSSRSRTSI